MRVCVGRQGNLKGNRCGFCQVVNVVVVGRTGDGVMG